MAIIRFYDRNLKPVGQPILESQVREARRRPNAADYASFSIPNDLEEQDQLGIATFVTIHEGYNPLVSGYTESRDLSGDDYSFVVQGHAHRLKQYKTPHQWQLWNGMDLADVAREHLKAFKSKRWNTKDDWQSAVRHNVDIEMEPGSVLLEMEPHPDDPDNTRPKAFGYVEFRLDLGDKALGAGRIARWSETVGSHVRISVQSRAAETQSALNSTPWGPEMTAVHVDTIQDNETKGVPVSGAGRWVDIRVNLRTEDQDSPRTGADGEIIGYGFTPILEGLELIWREPTFLEEGNIPQSTGVVVQGFEFNRVDFLQSLAELCNDNGWEFIVRHDEEQEKIVLDLGQNTNDGWKPVLGVDRTISSPEPLVIEHGRNIEIKVLRDNTAKIANILDCWGAGEGARQLHVQLRHEQSILENGEFPDDFHAPDVETMAELLALGQAELEKRAYPEVVFTVEMPFDHLEDFGKVRLGDTITVVHPKSRQQFSARIMEEGFQLTDRARTVRWGLNDIIRNPMEQMLGRRPSSRTLGELPKVPTQVIAQPGPGYNVVRWTSDADSWAIRYRTTGDGWHYEDVKVKEYVHTQVEPNTEWEYQVAAIKGKQISDWSASVYTTAEWMEDDPTPPDPASNLNAQQITDVESDGVVRISVQLTWDKSTSENAHQQFVQRTSGGATITLATLNKEAQMYVDTQRLRPGQSYTWQVVTVSKAGVYSSVNPTATLTIEGKTTAPGAPSNLRSTIDNDGNVVLYWQGVSVPDLKDYIIEIADNAQFSVGNENYFSMSNVFHLTGLAVDKKVYARVFARDRSGNVSPPSNVIEVSIPQLLSDTISESYLAKQRFELLLNRHFYGEEDGDFDGTHIRPTTVRTQALAVGSDARNFQLLGVRFEPNKDKVRGKLHNTAGFLMLVTDPEETINSSWAITEKTQDAALNKLFLVYAECRKTTPYTGQIVLSETKLDPETSSHYRFLIGVYDTTTNPAEIATNYGHTYITGNQITTGQILAQLVEIVSAGGRVKFTGDGLWGYNADGDPLVGFDTTTGEIVAGGGAVSMGEKGVRVYGYPTVSKEVVVGDAANLDSQNPDTSYPVDNPSSVITVKHRMVSVVPTVYEYKNAFVKFELPINIGSVEKATLTIDATPVLGTRINSPWAIGRVDNDWSPTTITYNNRPGVDETIDTTASALRDGVDITPWVNAWLESSHPNYGVAIGVGGATMSRAVEYTFPKDGIVCLVKYTDTSGTFVEERLRLGNVGGLPWGNTMLPPGTLGLHGSRAGVFLQGYSTLVDAGYAEDEDVIAVEGVSLVNPKIIVAPKEIVAYTPSKNSLTHLFTDAYMQSDGKFKIKAKTVVRGNPEEWPTKSRDRGKWTYTQPVGSIDGKKGVFTDFIVCRPEWSIHPLGAGVYTAKLKMYLTNEFNANGDPINWKLYREWSRNSSGSGVLNWDTAVPFGQWALRVEGDSTNPILTIATYVRTGIAAAGYHIDNQYINIQGEVITGDDPASVPSGMSVLYFIFDQG